MLACRNLSPSLPRVVAVVRPDDAALAAALGAAGARIVRCANADDGMGASLACGVRSTQDAAGWIVALGDMPWIASSTIARVAAAIADGAVVAAPFHRRAARASGGLRRRLLRRACRADRRRRREIGRRVAPRTASCGSTSTTPARCATSIGRRTSASRLECRGSAGLRTRRRGHYPCHSSRRQSLPSGCHMSGCSWTPRVSSSCAFHQARNSFSSSGRPIRNPCAASQP